MHFMVQPSILWSAAVGDVSLAGIDCHEASPVAQGLNTFVERLESGVVSCGEIIHPDVRLAQRVREADPDRAWRTTERRSLQA
jgi:hypothetical protein